MGEFAAKVYKYNKSGIEVHLLNQQSRASVNLKVSEALFSVYSYQSQHHTTDQVRGQETVRGNNAVLWATHRDSVERAV
jgi:hypothetical protein